MSSNKFNEGDGIVDFDLTLKMPSIFGKDAEGAKPTFMSEKYDSGEDAPKDYLSFGQRKEEDTQSKLFNTDGATYACFNAWTKGWIPPYNEKGDKAPGETTLDFTRTRTDIKYKLKHPRGKASLRGNLFVTPPKNQANIIPDGRKSDAAMNNLVGKRHGELLTTREGPRTKGLNNADPTSVRIEKALSRDHVRQRGSTRGRYQTRSSISYGKITSADRNNLDVLADIASGCKIKGSKIESKVAAPVEQVNTKNVKKDIMFDFFKTPERGTSSTLPDMHTPTIFDRVIDLQHVTRLILDKITSLEKDSRSRAYKCEDEDDVQVVPKPDTMKTKKRKTSVGQPILLFRHNLNAGWSERDEFDALMPTDYYKVKEFEEWYERKCLHAAYVALPIRMVGEASQDWFKPIWSSTGLLTDEHCDALINLLIIKSRRSPRWFETGWTCVESIGWQSMTVSNIELVKERILPYVDGSYPELGGLPWHLADSIYGIGHIAGCDHWVMYEISIIGQTIKVYDSLSESMEWETIEASFKNVRTNLAWLCEEGGVWERLKVDVEKRREWDLVPCPNLPQQTNGVDCGVMAMKYLECKASGRHLDLLQPERCVEYRRSFCAELYHLGVHCASGMDTALE